MFELILTTLKHECHGDAAEREYRFAIRDLEKQLEEQRCGNVEWQIADEMRIRLLVAVPRHCVVAIDVRANREGERVALMKFHIHVRINSVR